MYKPADGSAEELLERLRVRSHRMSRAHFLYARRLNSMHLSLGIPIVVLTGLTGSVLFSAVAKSSDSRLVAAAGCVSLLSAVLAALQTFFKYSDRSGSHHTAAGKFGSLKRSLDLLAVQLNVQPTNVELVQKLSECSDKFSELVDCSLAVPDRWYDRARTEQENDSEGV